MRGAGWAAVSLRRRLPERSADGDGAEQTRGEHGKEKDGAKEVDKITAGNRRILNGLQTYTY